MPPSVLARRRVGLSRPARPPAPNEAGSSNWATSVGGGGTGNGGSDRSSFVGFSLSSGGGGISFGGSESIGFNFASDAGGIRIGGSSTGIRIGESSSGGGATTRGKPRHYPNCCRSDRVLLFLVVDHDRVLLFLVVDRIEF